VGLATALAFASAATPARAQSEGQPTTVMDGTWHFVVAPYLWAPGIQGNVSAANLPQVPVEKPFSEIVKNLEFVLQAHFEARRDRLGLDFDVMYLNLGAPVASSAPLVGRLGLKADLKQLFVLGFVSYRVATGGPRDNPGTLDLLAGARYNSTQTGMSAQNGAGNTYGGATRDLQWVDAVLGVRFRAPLVSRVTVLGRGDVAGFGSKLTWNVEGGLAFLASRHWTLGAGWRHMDIDYDKGSGSDRRLFDMVYDGPRAWFAYSW
jgi:hypothetical protein